MVATELASLYDRDLTRLVQELRAFHLLGHFNYHLGQIDYLRRFTTGDGAIPLAARLG
jgi:hypothetical protein